MNCIKCSAPLPEGALYCPMCGKKQTAVKRRRRKRTNGSGSISKLSGNRAKPYLARKGDVVVGTYATVGEAEKALARLTDREVSDLYNMTFTQVYESWAPEHTAYLEARAIVRTGDRADTSGMEDYAVSYKHCAPLYERAFRKIRTSDVQAIIDSMQARGLSFSSRNKVRQLVSQMYQYAMRENIVTDNLAEYLTLLPDRKKERPTFTDDEVRLIKSSTLPAAGVVQILLATGVRIGELFKVPTELCYDTYFIGGSKTATGTNRIIPVSPLGIDAYTQLLTRAREKNLPRLIDAYEGNHDPANFRKRDYANLLEGLGIPYKAPHSSRRTYTTKAVQQKMPPEDLTKILGHSDYSVTVKYYDHPDADALVEAAKVVDV